MQTIKKFNSVSDLVGYAKQHHPAKSMWGEERESPNNKFYKTGNWQEAVALAESGWPEGVGKVSMSVQDLAVQAESKELGYTYDVSGEFLDIGAFVTGQPECWQVAAPVENKKQFNVYINVAIAGAVKENIVFNRGAAIVALVDELEKSHDVKLFAYAGAQNEGNTCELYVDLGRSPLDIDAVSYAFCHVSFFRRICTGAMDVALGINSIGEWKPMDMREVPDTSLYIDGIGYKEQEPFKSLESSKKWVKQTLKKYQI